MFNKLNSFTLNNLNDNNDYMYQLINEVVSLNLINLVDFV